MAFCSAIDMHVAAHVRTEVASMISLESRSIWELAV